MRCAIYFTPAAEHALTSAAAQWLRRNPYSGARVDADIEGLVPEDHAYLTAPVRRFGFHGPLKPAFSLAPGERLSEIADSLKRFCARLQPIVVPKLDIGFIERSFALVTPERLPELEALAASLTIEFDRFRAPLSERDIARQSGMRLNPRQLSNLSDWGHPNVFDQFRFQMPLTGQIDELEREHVAQVLARHFKAHLGVPMLIDQVALFVEPETNAPFCVSSVHPFSRRRARRAA